MNFLRQLYENRSNAYEISLDDILDKAAKAEIGKYMDDKFGVTLGDALDAIAGGPADFYYLVREQDDRRGDPSVMNIIHYGTAVCLLFRVY